MLTSDIGMKKEKKKKRKVWSLKCDLNRDGL